MTMTPGGRLREIVRQPLFRVAVLGATTGFGLMTLIMTATPLSMHINDHFSLEADCIGDSRTRTWHVPAIARDGVFN